MALARRGLKVGSILYDMVVPEVRGDDSGGARGHLACCAVDPKGGAIGNLIRTRRLVFRASPNPRQLPNVVAVGGRDKPDELLLIPVSGRGVHGQSQ